MSAPDIHPADPSQADELTALMHNSSAYQGEYASILHGYRLTPADLTTAPTFVARRGTEPLGFYRLIPDPPELDLLFVADHAQGLGLGRHLIRHMLAVAGERGLAAVRIVSHPPAADFYRRQGAQQVQLLPPSPPRVTWTRPEFRLPVPAPGNSAAPPGSAPHR
ncbi:GNAT family N-acetyltransferase [Crossiella sp. CA-258035]|uniref:GNAT family N-acetyltransferase n=1 Tax=Crossiella sp. CA-258035 TaxID=2981138 RepID=UPI0024BCD6E2|nr:GNAT family N-acetyltransferase [Crossiella sp. CA-258035]WHT15915.1 GNAT family N-acetyltransferase [Crossiella sp. CA-258035]